VLLKEYCLQISVIGLGSWGSALAILLARNGHTIKAWEYLPELVLKYNNAEREIPYLPGINLPEQIAVSSDLKQTLAGAELILLAVPSHALRDLLAAASAYIPENAILVDVAKGIEQHSLKKMSEVCQECLPARSSDLYTCLSGPSHAEEVSRRIPTAVVVAGLDNDVTHRVQHAFSDEFFRVYTNNDLSGVELGGALKNIVALASGMCDGLGFGDNSKGALLTRGMVEISRLGCKLGGRPETFWGLSGMGDMITTCMSKHSRNRHVGEQLGRGRKLQEILDEMQMVAEGVKTTDSAYELSRKLNVNMPITEAVYHVVFAGHDPKKEVYQLMTRSLKVEH
jgi:glycerol-3-phosphate dehydrogenase (NAD(P)+)